MASWRARFSSIFALLAVTSSDATEQCNCKKYPFTPEPPCYRRCTAALLSLSDLSDLEMILGLDAELAAKIALQNSTPGATPGSFITKLTAQDRKQLLLRLEQLTQHQVDAWVASVPESSLNGSLVSELLAREVPPPQNARPIDEVMITGSRIRRVDEETASPVFVMDASTIANTGVQTLGDLMMRVAAVTGTASVLNGFGADVAAGGAGVSLRGLGASSTLVLMNGRRIAPYGFAEGAQAIFTDVSVIPLEAVERIEILKDGGSVTYGSEAIAGVVNFVTKNDFTGFAGKGSFGSSRYGDGDTGKIALTYGLDEERYNMYFHIEGNDSNRVRSSDRRDRAYIGTGDLRPYGVSTTGSQFLLGFVSPGSASDMPTGALQDPTTGQYVSLPGCDELSTLPQDPSGGCLWEAGQFRYITADERYVNGFGRGTFDLSEEIEIYSELSYFRKESTFHTTPTGTSGAWGFPGGVVNASSGPGAIMLGATHPDNPYGQPVRLRYSFFDLGPIVTHNQNTFSRVLAGMQWQRNDWSVEASVLHSENDLTNQSTGHVRYSALRAALTDPGSPLFPFRVGVNANLNTQAQYDAISPNIHAESETRLDVVDIFGSGAIANLPGGALQIGVGAEYRHLDASLTPQSLTETGDVLGLGYSAYDSTTSVVAAYAELSAPVTELLDISAGIRMEHYAGEETSTTPKLSVMFRPFDELMLRATYARGFRVPNAAESAENGLAGFSSTNDPIRCPNGAPALGASQADCTVTVALISAPDRDLKPERSRSITAGLALDPIAQIHLSLDLWEIKRTGEINIQTLQEAIADGKTVREDNLLQGAPGTGTLLAVLTDYINSATTRVRGWDVAADYRLLDLSHWGTLYFDLQWAHIASHQRIEASGAKFEFAGTHGNCDASGCIGTPKDRINFGTTWNIGSFSLNTVVSFIDSFKNVDAGGQEGCNNRLADGSNSPNAACRIASFYSVGFNGTWQASDSLQVFGTIENAFDRTAPLDPRTHAAVSYNPMHTAGAIGRYYTVGMEYKFQ